MCKYTEHKLNHSIRKKNPKVITDLQGTNSHVITSIVRQAPCNCSTQLFMSHRLYDNKRVPVTTCSNLELLVTVGRC